MFRSEAPFPKAALIPAAHSSPAGAPQRVFSPESEFFKNEPAVPERWDAAPVFRASEPLPVDVPAAEGIVRLYPADVERRTVLAPVDPCLLLLRHRGELTTLEDITGSERLYYEHILPVIANWGSLVQAFPRDTEGLWSGADGLFEAGLAFAHGALNAADAEVIEPDMPPNDRAEWTERVRVAVVIAALLSDADRLGRLHIEAGVVDRRSGRFVRLETFSPLTDTAQGFATRHVGRTMRLSRHTKAEAAQHLTTLAADLFHKIVPQKTFRWLASLEKAGGESVAAALRSAVTFQSGVSGTERLITRAVARGREWGVEMRERAAAKRAGRSPVLAGFIEVFAAALTEKIASGEWPLNDKKSPLVWSEEGLTVAWPGVFVSLFSDLRDMRGRKAVPDEPDAAAEILTANGIAEPDAAGRPVRITERGTTVLLLADGERLIALARQTAARCGRPMPKPVPSVLPDAVRFPYRLPKKEVPKYAFAWLLSIPSACRDPDFAAMLERAVAALSMRPDAGRWGSSRGLFIPSACLEGWWSDPPLQIRPLLLSFELVPESRLRLPRESFLHRLKLTGTAAESAADLASGGKTVDGSVILEGLLIRQQFVRPAVRWADGTLSDTKPDQTAVLWPEADPEVQFIDPAHAADVMRDYERQKNAQSPDAFEFMTAGRY